MLPIPSPLQRLLRLAVLCISMLLSVTLPAAEPFPRPAELEPDVAFWVRVYSEIDTRSGFIHDSYKLGVVYETLELSGQRRADEKTISNAKKRYARILRSLAQAPGHLDAEQKRIRALWGSTVTSTQLLEAAANLRFQRGQSDRFRAGLARAGLWQAHIDQVLAERKLPPELAALPHVESSFNPEAWSSVGAAGIWQFTRSTGRRYMQVDYVVDERMDPFAATVAAAQLLEHNYQLTGTWPLALTAYNHGTAGMRRASRQLGTTDIDIIVRQYQGRSFGFASRNFYVSFLAALEVSQRPDHFFPQYDSYHPVQYARVKLPDYMPAEAFARAFNMEFEQLKKHNRALLEPVWRGKKHIPRDFTMRVPSSGLVAPAGELLAAVPAEQRFQEQTPDLFHKVVPGDTVSEIATRYGHNVRDVAAMNGLDRRYRIRIGQVLRLPLEGATPPVPHIEPSLAALEPEGEPEPEPVTPSTQPADQAAATTAAVPAATTGGELITTSDAADLAADPSDYTVASDGSIEVQAVETLGHYADWLDISASELRQLNGLRYGRPVVLGHRLTLDFSRVSQEEFERKRLSYQLQLQQNFFMTWHIQSTHSHVIAPGESLWELTQQRYKVPMWLLRQYNPDLNLDRLKPGTVVVIPELVKA